MLIACAKCHRQLDVGSHEPGALVRCFCGERITVPEPHKRDARMLHCSACGAGLAPGADRCGYCGAGVTLGAKGIGQACPGCFARLLADARFCSDCGLEIRPAAVLAAMVDHACPRCRSPLSECSAGDTQFAECTSCGGLWLAEDSFRRLTARREGEAPPPLLAARSKPRAAALRDPGEDLRKVVYLSCPVCSEKMNRRNFARSSGIILDWCRGHGFWFDADELDRVLRFVADGGLDRQREREKLELENERRAAQRRSVPVSLPIEGRSPGRFEGPDLIESLVRFVAKLLS